ncbi:DEAD/DEAH box helicase [Mycoplasmopsis columboralis]|uniref:Putative DNA helicase n=1 Tax=Mycoplasmopsis columboralis TaxID=171282 RepID=A0A449B7H1_9BACT|nr:DEAD/DEAH box helicase [Mycoplasmopsis columboralis]VEU76541.1 putative DNA helicase [Mycoplasmopsis columboralis]
MKKDKYQTILDNLLDIDPLDSSVFTKLTRNTLGQSNYFDIFRLFGKENFHHILNNEKFKLNLVEQTIVNAYENIQKTTNLNDLDFLLENLYKYEIVQDRNIRKQYPTFEQIKQKLTEHLEKLIQQSLFRWKRIKDRADTILEETNIWPLHIGFLFVSLKKDDKSIYAPLLLKEVQIDFENGKPVLYSNGEIKINDKLLFLLNNYGFAIDIDDNFKEFKITNLIDELRTQWRGIYSLPANIVAPFKEYKNEDIVNENLQFHPGGVLGIFQPSGGYPRNRMKQIIQSGKLESIIDVEINKTKYQEVVDKSIFNPKLSLFRLTSSNLSQDKAIISALNQNTIIWGPPGTGKSQTIVNLLTNILVYNKTAIVGSQKKVALEVIRKRMKSLAMFCLFVLNSKDMSKREFYKPIASYLNELEYHKTSTKIVRPQLASESEINFVKHANGEIKKPAIREALEAIYYLAENKLDFKGEEDILYAAKLPKNVVMPDYVEQGLTPKKLLELSGSKFFFTKQYRALKELGISIDQNLSEYKGSLKELQLKFKNLIPYQEGALNDDNVLYKLKNLEEMHSHLNAPVDTFDAEEIKKVILERISDKLEKLSDEDKQLYKEFSASVRIQNLHPHRFVKRYTSIIKKVFPIIIATPDSDLSGWEEKEFDYGILDESSQIFIENGLTFLYLAKTKILAGDQMQMRPSNWFGTRVTDDSIYGHVESMLDYAMGLGVYHVLLNKNYRSDYASLMTFSSQNFYNSQLDVVDNAKNSDKNPIEVYEVDGIWDDNKNEKEANLALEITLKELPNYSKIILLAFNAKQFNYLKDKIFVEYPQLENAIRNGQLMVKNLENIQGDEANLVIATVAYDKNAKLTSTYIAKQGGRNALNVAISRAKEKLIVIKTIKSEEVTILPNSSDDLIIFKKWLQFLESSPEKRLNLLNESFTKHKEKLSSNSEKVWFTKIVDKRLNSLFSNRPGFDVFKDYSIGSLTIDYVITFNRVPYKCLVVDVFNYDNGYADYALLKDKVKFLKNKNYDVELLNPLNYVNLLREFEGWIKDKNLIDFKDHTKEFNTAYYTLNEINNTKLTQEVVESSEETNEGIN